MAGSRMSYIRLIVSYGKVLHRIYGDATEFELIAHELAKRIVHADVYVVVLPVYIAYAEYDRVERVIDVVWELAQVLRALRIIERSEGAVEFAQAAIEPRSVQHSHKAVTIEIIAWSDCQCLCSDTRVLGQVIYYWRLCYTFFSVT